MCSPADRASQRAALDRLDAVERQESVLLAARARALAAVGELWAEDQGGGLLEVAGTCRVGQVRAGGDLTRADRLVRLYPLALELLEAGVMRVGTARLLLEVTVKASEQVQRLVDARLSEQLWRLDAVDARRRLAEAVIEIEAELDDLAQRERLEQARADRGVWVKPVEDGMARVGAELPATEARRWSMDLEELVRAQKVLDDRTGVTRTQAQRRADVFAELPSRLLALTRAAARGRLGDVVVGGDPASGPTPTSSGDDQDELPLGVPPAGPVPWWQRPDDELLAAMLAVPLAKPCTLLVHVPMTTLLDMDQRTGWLDGYGPVPALHARMLLTSAALRRVAVDERTGAPLGVDPRTGPDWRAPWLGEMDLEPGSGHRPGPPGCGPGSGPGGDPPGDPPPGPAGGPLAEAVRARLVAMLGAPMYVDDRVEAGYVPSAALRESARIRDAACDGPGCPRAARACELDHETDRALGGVTALWNLRHRSSRCHHVKHDGWTVTHDESAAVTTWTSPIGSRYDRRSPWRSPMLLPDVVRLPAPQLVVPWDLEASWWRQSETDRPLWQEPAAQPARPARRRTGRTGGVGDADQVAPAPSGAAPTGWYDGPPPF